MASSIEKSWKTTSGLDAVVVVVDNGKYGKHRCGYVRVPSSHPLYRKGYGENVPALAVAARGAKLGSKSPVLAITAGVDALPGEDVRWSADVAIDVHGGITYADDLSHILGYEEDWWFGFDCNHYRDARWDVEAESLSFTEGVVRTLNYAESECERMAEQLAAIK